MSRKKKPPTQEEKLGKAKGQLHSAEVTARKLHTELEDTLRKAQHTLSKSWLASLEKCESTLKASVKKEHDPEALGKGAGGCCKHSEIRKSRKEGAEEPGAFPEAFGLGKAK